MNILVQCPSCSEKGYIEVDNDTFKNNPRGIIAINIIEDLICQHSCIVYVDKNFSVRDYFIADLYIEIPDMASPKEIEENIPIPDNINVFLIRINLHAILITYLIKSIFH